MYLDLWKALKNQAYSVRTPSDLVTLMNRLEQRALDEALFEKHPHRALKHLRRIHLHDFDGDVPSQEY